MMVPSGVALLITSVLLEAYRGPSESLAVSVFIGVVLIVAGVAREFRG